MEGALTCHVNRDGNDVTDVLANTVCGSRFHPQLRVVMTDGLTFAGFNVLDIGELASHRVTHPKEVVKEGDQLSLRIIRIDPARRRMGLSLKRVAEEEYAEVDWREAYSEDEGDWDTEEEES